MVPFINSHELYLIYNPTSELGRKTHALAISLNDVVHEINVMKKMVTPLKWKEFLDMLGLAAIEILDKGNPDYERLILNKNYAEKDLLEIIYQNPQLVKGPIGILRNKAILCNSPKDILHLDLTPGAEKAAYHE